MRNQEVRQVAAVNKIKLWQIADAIGMCDSNFSRLLRKELPPEKKARILSAIKHIQEGGANDEQRPENT